MRTHKGNKFCLYNMLKLSGWASNVRKANKWSTCSQPQYAQPLLQPFHIPLQRISVRSWSSIRHEYRIQFVPPAHIHHVFEERCLSWDEPQSGSNHNAIEVFRVELALGPVKSSLYFCIVKLALGDVESCTADAVLVGSDCSLDLFWCAE